MVRNLERNLARNLVPEFSTEFSTYAVCPQDFCLPGCNQYQQMHSDFPMILRDSAMPPVVVVNYPMVNFTLHNGPMRVIPGGSHRWTKPHVPLADEPSSYLYSTLVGCPAGGALFFKGGKWA